MTNGSNIYGVTFPQILFLTRVLRHHRNVREFSRTRDIQFDLVTARSLNLRLICLNEYTCGIARILEVQDEFPNANIIYVGGNWNGYTGQAKEYCVQSELGLFNADEINGALHRDDFWNYFRKNENGDPVYPTKAS